MWFVRGESGPGSYQEAGSLMRIMVLYPVSPNQVSHSSSHASREKGWLGPLVLYPPRSQNFPDLKSWSFGWYAYSALLTKWEGGVKKLVCRKCKCRGSFLASIFLLTLGEKLWDEVGTQCLFQIGTYGNPRPAVVRQIGGLCLSVPSMDVVEHLCLPCVQLL